MRTAIDCNVISAIWSSDSTAERMAEQLGRARMEGALLVSPFVFAELLAYPGATEKSVRTFLEVTCVVIDIRLQERLWLEAGLRFARYARRRRESFGEGPRRLLADFLVGAHALVQADRLLTLDPKVFRQDFPELHII